MSFDYDLLSDSNLLLFHYGDGLDAATRTRIAVALSAQPELASHLQAMVAQLDAVAASPEVAVPAEVKQRWLASLDHVAQRDVNRQAPLRRLLFADFSWGRGAAIFAAVLLVSGVGLGVFNSMHHDEAVPPAPINIATAPNPLRIERGLQWHLAQTEKQLASLESAPGHERSQLIDGVIAQNSLYALAAERANEQRLARVLRSFRPILESLADQRIGNSEFSGGIAQLNFELKVMQAKLATTTAMSTPPAVAPNMPDKSLAL